MPETRSLDALFGAYTVRVPVGPGLFGQLVAPPASVGLTLFAHGSGSPLLDALTEMERQRRTRALVVGHGDLAGLLSITDVARVVTEAVATRTAGHT